MFLLQIFYFFVLFETVNCCRSGTKCSSNQRRNPVTDRCVDNPPPSTRPSVWLESCSAVSQDCTNYGLDFDLSYSFGDNIDCFHGGMAIRCMVKPKPPLTVTSASSFKYLSYNIFERFHMLTIDGQRERTCRLPTWILETIPDIDAIGFQEAFIGGCFEDNLNLTDILEYYDFKYFTPVVDNAIRLNGGIFIASKWPIVRKEMYIFQNIDIMTAEVFVAKGVSYAHVEKTVNGVTKPYHLMSSHLQSGGGNDNTIRLAQCGEVDQFIKTLNIPANEPIMHASDLNLKITEHDLLTCLGLFNGKLPPLTVTSNIDKSWDPQTNTILKINNADREPKWLDFVFYHDSHKDPINSAQTILNAKVQNDFEVCYAEEVIDIFRQSHRSVNDCDYDIERFNDLSDHYPILGTFNF